MTRQGEAGELIVSLKRANGEVIEVVVSRDVERVSVETHEPRPAKEKFRWES